MVAECTKLCSARCYANYNLWRWNSYIYLLHLLNHLMTSATSQLLGFFFCCYRPEASQRHVTRSGSIINGTVFGIAMETQDGTHRTRCGREQTLCLARRRLETVWQSWCTGGRSESQNSQFSFSSGSTLSSRHIPLMERRDTREKGTGERQNTGSSTLMQREATRAETLRTD